MDEQALARKSVLGLRPYSPGKPIEEVEREYGVSDIIKLASNENPLGPSPLAIQAIQKAVGKVRLYPDNECFYLKRALAAHLGVGEEQIVVGRGSDEVIHMMGLAFLEPGDEVIMADPPFTLYEFTAQLMGCKQVRVPLRDFTHDLVAMKKQVTERTKLIFIANPHNPTGTIVTRQEVEALMEGLPERAILALDEAYFEYVDHPHYPDTLEYVRQGRNIIVTRTFSKIYALAGLRIGYGVARPGLARLLDQVREPFNVSGLAQEAALASLSDPHQVERSRRCNQEGKEFLYSRFGQMGLSYVPTQANFILVDLGVDSRLVFPELLKRGVIVRTGDIFGLPTHIRVTIGRPQENQRLVEALAQVLATIGGGLGHCDEG